VIEIILLFLALLELLKQGSIDVQQEAFCTPIRLVFVPEESRETHITSHLSDLEETDDDA
jgi:chromatin segregation and condensation protein Rec8/ScpA/Scc1 (kleisin family)